MRGVARMACRGGLIQKLPSTASLPITLPAGLAESAKWDIALPGRAWDQRAISARSCGRARRLTQRRVQDQIFHGLDRARRECRRVAMAVGLTSDHCLNSEITR